MAAVDANSRIWVASAVIGAAWAYDNYRKKKWPMVAWGAGESAFALYKMRMNEKAHQEWLQRPPGAPGPTQLAGGY